jgi:hypothetical protein
VLTPTIITGTDYVGFRASFTGFSSSARFFLVDDTLCAPPLVTISPAVAQTICAGDSLSLTATSGSGYSYQWTRNGTDIPSATSSSYFASQAGSYSLRVTNAGGCSASPAALSISKDSVAQYALTGGGAFCAGTNGPLVGLSGSQTDTRYQLYRDGSAIASPTIGTGSAISFGSYSTAGSYTVVATRIASSCQDTMQGQATITLLPTPDARITNPSTIQIDHNSSATLLAHSAAGYQYQWLHNDVLVSGQSDSLYTTSLSGSYKVIVSLNGCVDTSDATIVNAIDIFDLRLLPNPNDGNFGIKGKMKNPFDGTATIIITNMLGQKVYRAEAPVAKGIMDTQFALSGLLAKATYMVSVWAGDEEFVFHLSVR